MGLTSWYANALEALVSLSCMLSLLSCDMVGVDEYLAATSSAWGSHEFSTAEHVWRVDIRTWSPLHKSAPGSKDRMRCRTLNRIQSRIYPTAFGSNENVLVSAPTGAGKTNIAMIAVLREVGNNMSGGMIDKV